MGLVSGNRLNRFWKKGVKPIKDAIGVLTALSTVEKSTLVAAINELAEGKFDVAKLVASTNITEPGFAMDGKTASEAITELYSKNDYSFEETCIGTWANGKPLYRKVIMTAVNYTASESYVTYAIPHNISNISSVCMICAWMQSVGNDTVYVLPYTHPTSGEIETFVTALNRSSISMRNKAAWGNYNFVTVIEYTKTTD